MHSDSCTKNVTHEIPPVWNAESRVLLLGTMPSPASRKAGFFYMHGQNRFWRVLPAVFRETFETASNSLPRSANANETEIIEYTKSAIAERREFLLRHKIALWDVLSSCDITGASDASIKNAVPNDFTEIFTKSKIRRVFCTGKTAFNFWKKHCAKRYETQFGVRAECLPSTSPANAKWVLKMLVAEYSRILEWLK